MNMDKIFRVWTEGDVEGITTVTCGYLKAKSREQVEHFLQANPKVFDKCYNYYVDEFKVIDISNNDYEVINQCSKCHYKSNTKFCPECGGRIVQVVVNK